MERVDFFIEVIFRVENFATGSKGIELYLYNGQAMRVVYPVRLITYKM